MKKVLSMILLIALIAVPVGCSDQNKEASKYEAPTAAKTTSAQTTAGAETTAAPETTQEPTEAEPETTAPLSVESYIKIYKEGSYYNSLLNEEDSYAMPLINIDSPDANAINLFERLDPFALREGRQTRFRDHLSRIQYRRCNGSGGQKRRHCGALRNDNESPARQHSRRC